MTSRNLMATLAIKYKGEWEKEMKAIREKEKLTDEDVNKYISKVKGYNFVTILDAEYPESLKKIFQPPLVLFYKGNINLFKSKKTLGVCGTRDVSDYGKRVTSNIIGDYIANHKDVPIVTGLSCGVSKEAASAATAVDGKIILVMISGIENVYPKEMKGLYDEACRSGLVVSEYPGDVNAAEDHGPMRDRIIAGLSSKLLATEAKMNSGCSITVMYALSQGKDVMAVPCNVDVENNTTNKYIQDGALLVMNVEDVEYIMSEEN